MARRWEPDVSPNELRPTNLFHRFADRLRAIYERYELDPTYQIDRKEPIYENIGNEGRSCPRHWIPPSELAGHIELLSSGLNVAGPTWTLVQNTDPLAGLAGDTNDAQVTDAAQPCMAWIDMDSNESILPEDNLMVISQALMGPSFTDLDRVVSFDEMMMSGISEEPINWEFGTG